MSYTKDQINYGKFPKIVALIYVALIILMIGLMILSFPLGLYTVLNLEIGVINTIIFISLWFIYLALFIEAIRGPRLPLNRVPRSTLNYGLKSVFDNTSSALAVTLSALFLIILFIELLQESVGIRTGSPDIDPILTFIAPIDEEIIFRVAIIGTVTILLLSMEGRVIWLFLLSFTLVVILLSLIIGLVIFALLVALLLLIKGVHFNPFKVLWHPAKYISELGTKTNMKVIYFAILISGAFFGYAHIAPGGGWEIGKFTPSFLAGIVFGLIYFFYGFPGVVLLHWSFNYFLEPFFYFGNVIGESSLYFTYYYLIFITGPASILFLLIYTLQNIKAYNKQRSSESEEKIEMM
ncbi:MAG: hypothetical protein QXD82_05420 [Nitrososphaerales archaeon]